jgi:hypothetical protein
LRALFESFVSEHLLITAAAYVSLLFTLMLLLWLKFAELVHAIWTSIKNAIRDFLDFRDELQDRRPKAPINHPQV